MTLKGETATEHSHLGFQTVAFSLSPEIPARARELAMLSCSGDFRPTLALGALLLAVNFIGLTDNRDRWQPRSLRVDM